MARTTSSAAGVTAAAGGGRPQRKHHHAKGDRFGQVELLDSKKPGVHGFLQIHARMFDRQRTDTRYRLEERAEERVHRGLAVVDARGGGQTDQRIGLSATAGTMVAITSSDNVDMVASSKSRVVGK